MPETITAPPPSPNATQTPDTTPKTNDGGSQPSHQATDGSRNDGTKTADPMRDVFSPKEVAKQHGGDKGKPAEPAKDDKEKPAEGAEKGAVKKPDEAAPVGEKKVVVAKKPEGDNSVITQIRNAEKAAKNEAAEWRGKYEELQKKGGGDTSALTTSLAEKDKRIKELEGEVGTLNYRKNPDYVKNYEAPFKAAQKSAQNVIESLKVITGKDEEGNLQTRTASWLTDFIPLTNVVGDTPAQIRAAAREQIKAKFGEDAPEAMQQWDKLYELNDKRQESLREYAEKHGEMEAQARSKQIQQAENFKSAFSIASKDLLAQNPDLFGEKPDDAEGNELMKKMDAIIGPLFHNPETLAPQEFVARMAAAEHRLRVFPRLQRDNAALQDRVAELEARINGTEESTNGKTRKTGEEIAGQDPDEKDRQKMREAWA